MNPNGPVRFGILGAGLIGGKRAEAILATGNSVVGVYDISVDRAKAFGEKFSCPVFQSRDSLLDSSQVDAVVVSTTNDAAASCIVGALKAGKHALVEKPAGRNPVEVREWVSESKRNEVVCRAGFNHRFHPALQKAKTLLEQGSIGDLMFFRGRYGHGGRTGYEREWRADPKLGGGGELLDQGVHLIDLCRWLGGEFEVKFGYSTTFFWDMPVEDNGFLCLQSPNGKRLAWLHASCTEWKNRFDFELFGTSGKIEIQGLGRSYGVEQLIHYRRRPDKGVPDMETFSYPGEDRSWEKEVQAFIQEVRGERTDMGGPEDALRAVEIVYEVYERSSAPFLRGPEGRSNSVE